MPELSGWGRFPVVPGSEARGERLEALTRESALTRGLGRSYGDASLPARAADRVVNSRLADRLLAFDPESGRLRAEAGLSLDTLQRIFVPRGFASPVSPGTWYVTLGGMVAADVHGKNHHGAGSFGRHVRALRVRLADDTIVECSAEHEPELFFGCQGGLGLLGHVLEVDLELQPIPSPWFVEETEAFPDLHTLIAGLRRASADWPYSVAWVDTTARGAARGRGILSRSRWARPAEAPGMAPRLDAGRVSLPFAWPRGCIAPWSIGLFNRLWYALRRRAPASARVSPRTSFTPLDGVGAWNLAYGPAGFVQHQCVLPDAPGDAAWDRIFDVLHEHRGASPVSVLKDFGPESAGTISFPRPGLTLALDFPWRGDETRALIDALNRVVRDAGGRVYLAKDALSRAEDLRAMDPRLERFAALRERFDPKQRLRSALSVRLFGDEVAP